MFAAILNSSVGAWYIDLNGRKFDRGYNEVGVSLLRRFPMPNLNQVSSPLIHNVVNYVSKLMSSYEDFNYENASELDDIVLRDLYRLDSDDVEILKSGTYL